MSSDIGRNWTTWCAKHAALELVDEVGKIRRFMVMKHTVGAQSEHTGRSACEVWAVTDSGCKVHFIGGPKWNA